MICLFMFILSVAGLSLTFTFKMAIYTVYESLTKYVCNKYLAASIPILK